MYTPLPSSGHFLSYIKPYYVYYIRSNLWNVLIIKRQNFNFLNSWNEWILKINDRLNRQVLLIFIFSCIILSFVLPTSYIEIFNLPWMRGERCCIPVTSYSVSFSWVKKCQSNGRWPTVSTLRITTVMAKFVLLISSLFPLSVFLYVTVFLTHSS